MSKKGQPGTECIPRLSRYLKVYGFLGKFLVFLLQERAKLEALDKNWKNCIVEFRKIEKSNNRILGFSNFSNLSSFRTVGFAKNFRIFEIFQFRIFDIEKPHNMHTPTSTAAKIRDPTTFSRRFLEQVVLL